MTWSGKRRLYGGVKQKSQDCTDVITFDFQQNLETPSLHLNDMFYLRQLWTYYFGIHDYVQGRGMYVYIYSARVSSCFKLKKVLQYHKSLVEGDWGRTTCDIEKKLKSKTLFITFRSSTLIL